MINSRTNCIDISRKYSKTYKNVQHFSLIIKLSNCIYINFVLQHYFSVISLSEMGIQLTRPSVKIIFVLTKFTANEIKDKIFFFSSLSDCNILFIMSTINEINDEQFFLKPKQLSRKGETIQFSIY